MPLPLFAPIDRWRAPAPDARKIGWIGQHIFAHRGLHGPGAPENSPSAFAAAIARGFGIECDVQRSNDGQAMVFHDRELGRLTGESGLVSTRSAQQLGQIALSGSSDTIPKLRQLLDQVRPIRCHQCAQSDAIGRSLMMPCAREGLDRASGFGECGQLRAQCGEVLRGLAAQ